jgi:hypothetical protein
MVETRQAVSHLKFSDEVSWLRGLVFQLLAQVRHVNANVVGALNVAGPPDFQKKLAMSQNLAVAAHERRQQPKLDRG